MENKESKYTLREELEIHLRYAPRNVHIDNVTLEIEPPFI